MAGFSMEFPTKIYFGTGITKEAIIQEKNRFTGRNILIITTGRSLIRFGYINELQKLLHQETKCNKVFIFDEVSANPQLSEVKKASLLGKEEKVDLVIGFGGGSAMDAAKAVAAGISYFDEIDSFFLEGIEPSKNTLPIIAIPTTAGTGSELSKAAILSSDEYQMKNGIRGKNMIPKVAIVDPQYTWTVPKVIIAETGFDVLAHAIESYVAVKANLYSEMLSEKAIRIVGKCMPVLLEDCEQHELREQMAFASMIMGYNLANVGTALPHRMQYPIGSQTNTSHGAGLIALYPTWTKYEYEVNPQKIENILKWLGYESVKDANQVKEAFQDLIEKWGVPYTLQMLGIKKNQLENLADKVTGNIANDILSKQTGIISTIIREAYR